MNDFAKKKPGDRDGRGHVLCNTLGGGYDAYSTNAKGFGGTKGKWVSGTSG